MESALRAISHPSSSAPPPTSCRARAHAGSLSGPRPPHPHNAERGNAEFCCPPSALAKKGPFSEDLVPEVRVAPLVFCDPMSFSASSSPLYKGGSTCVYPPASGRRVFPLVVAPRPLRTKVFNDSVHGAIELHPLSAKIIDTVEYQRLRRLKQLGGAYSVFPAASHNRFEHCLGVAWMARRFVAHLRDKQPELGVTPVEALCVEVAGLCHDLGHGVMSHMFDAKFIPAVHGEGVKWQHEFASVGLLRLLFEKNPDVAEEAKAWGVDEPELHFMQELILGGPGKGELPQGFEWAGRGPAKQFLYEIVANKRSGIDVDKWDYFQRDSRQLGVPQSFDHGRLLLLARVVHDEKGVTTIAYPVKEAWSIYQMFHARFNLHKKAYQHRVARVVEYMAMEALLLANDHVLCVARGAATATPPHLTPPHAHTHAHTHPYPHPPQPARHAAHPGRARAPRAHVGHHPRPHRVRGPQ